MGTRQSGDDRGGSVAQERRRCQDGWNAFEKENFVMIDMDYKEKLEMEEDVPVLERDLEAFGFTARCPGCVSLLKGTARQAQTEICRRRIEVELRSNVKAEAAQRRVKEYQEKGERNERSRAWRKDRLMRKRQW